MCTPGVHPRRLSVGELRHIADVVRQTEQDSAYDFLDEVLYALFTLASCCFLCCCIGLVYSIRRKFCKRKRSVAELGRFDSFISRGPDISFLSAFPAEREFLFPPLTYLAPTGNVEKISVGGASWDVVDVKPHL